MTNAAVRPAPADPPRGLTVGGQALIEGVLMRGPHRVARAVRHPDGHVVVESEPWSPRASGPATWPLARGVVALVDSLRIGLGALRWSATVADTSGELAERRLATVLATAVAFSVAVLVFVVAPAVATQPLTERWGPSAGAGAESAIRLALLLAYLAAVRRNPHVRRVFAYHGAEHKAVAAYEAGAPLHPVAARPFGIRHARCGTTFLLDVAVLSAVVHTVTNVWWPHGVGVVASRLVVLPLVAALAYEVLRLAADHLDTSWGRALARPGLALQGLTTDEPDDDQVEVALVALVAALGGDRGAVPAGR